MNSRCQYLSVFYPMHTSACIAHPQELLITASGVGLFHWTFASFQRHEGPHRHIAACSGLKPQPHGSLSAMSSLFQSVEGCWYSARLRRPFLVFLWSFVCSLPPPCSHAVVSARVTGARGASGVVSLCDPGPGAHLLLRLSLSVEAAATLDKTGGSRQDPMLFPLLRSSSLSLNSVTVHISPESSSLSLSLNSVTIQHQSWVQLSLSLSLNSGTIQHQSWVQLSLSLSKLSDHTTSVLSPHAHTHTVRTVYLYICSIKIGFLTQCGVNVIHPVMIPSHHHHSVHSLQSRRMHPKDTIIILGWWCTASKYTHKPIWFPCPQWRLLFFSLCLLDNCQLKSNLTICHGKSSFSYSSSL